MCYKFKCCIRSCTFTFESLNSARDHVQEEHGDIYLKRRNIVAVCSRCFAESVAKDNLVCDCKEKRNLKRQHGNDDCQRTTGGEKVNNDENYDTEECEEKNRNKIHSRKRERKIDTEKKDGSDFRQEANCEKKIESQKRKHCRIPVKVVIECEENKNEGSDQSIPNKIKTNPQRGRTICTQCNKIYNNSSVPANCEQCMYYLGGTFSRKCNTQTSRAIHISDGIYSVRKNVSGKCTRVFVDLIKGTCTSENCMGLKNVSDCEHILSCKTGFVDESKILAHDSGCDKELNVILDTKDLSKKINYSELKVHLLPDKQYCVPYIFESDWSAPIGYVHVVIGQSCTGIRCRKPKGSGKHRLVKTVHSCIHSSIAELITQTEQTLKDSVKSDRQPFFDKDATVSFLIKEIKNRVPNPFDESEELDYISRVSKNVSLVQQNLEKYCRDKCPSCKIELVAQGRRKPEKSYLLTTKLIVEIDPIKTMVCPECKTLFFPELLQFGFLTLGSKAIVGYDFHISVRQSMIAGASMIQTICDKINLMCDCDALERLRSVHNLALVIEKWSLVVDSLILSLDQVICLLCGIIARQLSMDGNSKSSIALGDHIKLEDSAEEIPDLDSFVILLCKEVMKKSLFKEYSMETRNALKFPIMMAKAMKRDGPEINREHLKDSYFSKKILSEVSLVDYSNFVENGMLEIHSIEKYEVTKLRKLAKDLGIKSANTLSQSGLVQTFLALDGMLRSGKSSCHGYVAEQARTGGYYISYCNHETITATKMEVRMESVVDATDIFMSHKFPPVVVVGDDACNIVSHMLKTFPEESKLFFGNKRGCFETPSRDKSPTKDIDVPDILPDKFRSGEININLEALKNPKSFIHPLTGKTRRYVSGHRLGKKSRRSHKSRLCAYHDVDLTKQGKFVRTMCQEAHMNARKIKRVVADRKHSIETSYLFNMFMDYHWNHKKYKETLKKIKKVAVFGGRDPLSYRAITLPKHD